MTENFKDHPISITESLALKTQDARKWTPRDVLINTLRDLDDGKIKPEALVVGYYEILEDEKISTYLCYSAKNVLEASGLLARMTIVLES